MRAVCGREGVGAEHVAQGGHLRGQIGIVFGFALVKAGVFKKQHLPVLQRVHGGLRGGADAIGGKQHRRAEGLFQRGHKLLQRQVVHPLAPGTAEMRQQDRLAPGGKDIAHGGYDAGDAGCIGDGAVNHGYVDVHTCQDALSCQVHLVEGFPGHVPNLHMQIRCAFPSGMSGAVNALYWLSGAG